jgi:2,3-bisphosphoglycerate-independent phosphoglycerate mutase
MLARKLSEHLTPGGYFVTMTEYDTQIPSRVLFAPKHIETTLAREISLAGKKQVHIAETEKYAHATYFLNGGIEGTYAGEDHVLIHSRKDVKTHDEAPEMRAQEITNETIAAMQKGVDFLFVNYANPDMIGHTGNVPAIIRAIEEVDRSLSRVVAVAEQEGYVLLITADHGNAELNIDQDTGVAHTAHTTNLVPCVVVGVSDTLRPGAGLADIAPTILKLMDIQQPEAMTGKSLL